MGRWKPLVGLGIAQFLMVLDTAVMNVSISQLVHDFHTEVTTIQAVITLYALVMAALMITGGKLGDIWGRRRHGGVGSSPERDVGMGQAAQFAGHHLRVLADPFPDRRRRRGALRVPAVGGPAGAATRGPADPMASLQCPRRPGRPLDPDRA